MLSKVISIKIANRVLTRSDTTRGLRVFPFERVYLTQDTSIIPRIFEYFLSMPLTSELLTALNNIKIHKVVTKSVQRNDQPQRAKGSHDYALDQFKELSLDQGWSIIVPTGIKTRIINTRVISLIDYVTVSSPSPSISLQLHQNADLPQILLHTPNAETTILCGKCANLTRMYNGDCTPGTSSCAENHKIVLKVHEKKYDVKGRRVPS